MKVDILYCAWNRLEMTTATWAWMLAHTNWRHVQKLVVYDDGSEDGTLEFLREQTKKGRLTIKDRTSVRRYVPCELRVSDLRSPPAMMNHYVATAETDVFVKVDNDIALPGAWLEAMLSLAIRQPEIELLGMEAGMVEMAGRDGKEWDGKYRFTPASNIGGVGLMRLEAFRSRPPLPERGRFGFTDWQNRYNLVRGWITPDVHCPQLDRVPVEPYVSLTETYIEKGWNREWPKYHERWMEPYWEWILPAKEEPEE